MTSNGQTPPVWMTTEQVRERLGLESRGTLDSWAKRRQGPRFYRFGRTRRYDKADVEAWLKSCLVETGPA